MTTTAELRSLAMRERATATADDHSLAADEAYAVAREAFQNACTPVRILSLLDAHDAAVMALRDMREQHIGIVERACDDIMSRTETPIKRAKEDGWLSEQCHQEGRWHGANDCRQDIIAAIRILAEVQSSESTE